MTDNGSIIDSQQDTTPSDTIKAEAEQTQTDSELNARRFRWNREYVGWIVGGISILVTLSIFWFSRTAPKPTYILPNEPSIVFDSTQAESSIRVLDSDGNLIKSNVYLISVTFWNSGNEGIEPEEIRVPVRIELSPIQNILSAEVIRQTIPESTRFTANITQPDGNNSEHGYVELNWDHLDPKSGAIIQIIYQGDQPASASIAGQIYKIPSSRFVDATREIDLNRWTYQIPFWVIVFLVFLISIKVLNAFSYREHSSRLLRHLASELQIPAMNNALSYIIALAIGILLIKAFLTIFSPKAPL